jgi:hypothetical protein
MPVPEGKEIGYECENGHVNDHHKTRPAGHTKNAVCIDCNALVTRTLIPLRQCADCANVWPYTGDADRPTCPNCAGKRTARVDE